MPTYEVIYLIAKSKFKLAPKASGHGDVWEFTQEMDNKHPAAFPMSLIDRIVSSTNSQIILDPFMGSGTTAISAINFDRDFIGEEGEELTCNFDHGRGVGRKTRCTCGSKKGFPPAPRLRRAGARQT